MLMSILTVIYVLLAIAMIAMILMQRGAGAQAGSGFGGGASATVFGSRGASSFLSKSTKWMAITFFALSLFMAWHATRNAGGTGATDLGVMAQQPASGSAPQAPAAQVPAAPAGNGAVPAAPATAPQQSETGSSVPAAPAQTDAQTPPAPQPSGQTAPQQD